jgi:hypothetical protein
MTQPAEPNFDASEQAILDGIDRHLRAQGWAKHSTVEWLLREWRTLSTTVDRYKLTIDDYTNDLTSRDGLEIVLANCHGPLQSKIRAHIEQSDQQFLARTEEDTRKALWQFYQIDASSGWWWRRNPTTGPLADYLANSVRA